MNFELLARCVLASLGAGGARTGPERTVLQRATGTWAAVARSGTGAALRAISTRRPGDSPGAAVDNGTSAPHLPARIALRGEPTAGSLRFQGTFLDVACQCCHGNLKTRTVTFNQPTSIMMRCEFCHEGYHRRCPGMTSVGITSGRIGPVSVLVRGERAFREFRRRSNGTRPQPPGGGGAGA